MPFALGGSRTFAADFFVYGKREENGLYFLIFGKLVRKYGSGQGIVRKKEAGVRLRLWNGTKKAAITVLCLAGAYFFYIVFQLWRYAD